MLIYIGLPLLAAGLMPLFGRLSKRVLPDLIANAVFLFLTANAAAAVIRRLVPNPLFMQGGVQFFLLNDSLSLFLLFTIGLVSFCVSLYSVSYASQFGAKYNYYALMLLLVAGMNGLVISNDLFSVYLFLEITSIASYGLITFGLKYEEMEGAFKYLLLSSVATAFILLGIGLLYFLTGSLDFSATALQLKIAGEGARNQIGRAHV
jgi:multicomponent Na+:H+ antiporter subunit D